MKLFNFNHFIYLCNELAIKLILTLLHFFNKEICFKINQIL